VIELAARKIPRYTDALDTLKENLTTLEAALQIAFANRARLVYASTSDVYGKSRDLPFTEAGDLCLGPSTSRRWAYAVSKIFGEHLILAHADRYGLESVIVRLFGSYGPRNRLDWWGGPQGVFIDCLANGRAVPIHGDGNQTRSFTFVHDTACGVVMAAEKKQGTGQIINIGSAEEITVLDLARLIQQLCSETTQLEIDWIAYEELGKNYEDVRRRVPDQTKAQELLGFLPQTSLRTGLERTIEWYRSLSPELKALYGARSMA
jgi:UDP-glucose 4-epimerase